MAEFFTEIGNFFNDIINNILNLLFDFGYSVMDLFFGWINFPSFPDEFKYNINMFLDIIFNSSSLLGFFIRPITLAIVFPLINISFIGMFTYKIIRWILRIFRIVP